MGVHLHSGAQFDDIHRQQTYVTSVWRCACSGDLILSLKDTALAAETCEELFTPHAPHIALALNGVEIISNGSGSHHQLRCSMRTTLQAPVPETMLFCALWVQRRTSADHRSAQAASGRTKTGAGVCRFHGFQIHAFECPPGDMVAPPPTELCFPAAPHN